MLWQVVLFYQKELLEQADVRIAEESHLKYSNVQKKFLNCSFKYQ